MKNKKIIIALASVGMIIVMAVGGTLAYFTDADKMDSSLKAGKVSISITERSSDANAVVNTDSNSVVTGIEYSKIMPGDKISKEPIVVVGDDSNDAYVRAKIEIAGVDNDFSETDGLKDYLKDISFNTAACDWVLGDDGYYYYQNIADSVNNKNISIFTETYIPTGWGAEIRNKSFQVKIYAQAIQADYLEPIRNSDNNIVGWND